MYDCRESGHGDSVDSYVGFVQVAIWNWLVAAQTP